jgi:hypothetical protein
MRLTNPGKNPCPAPFVTLAYEFAVLLRSFSVFKKRHFFRENGRFLRLADTPRLEFPCDFRARCIFQSGGSAQVAKSSFRSFLSSKTRFCALTHAPPYGWKVSQ